MYFCLKLPSASSWGCELKYIIPLCELTMLDRQPLREAVSWNRNKYQKFSWYPGQPLREAVSWNTCTENHINQRSVSASSWGCELKYYILKGEQGWTRSASSWGCELKSFADPVFFCQIHVSLFVRLWVEILSYLLLLQNTWSASSWGCELKCAQFRGNKGNCCQPLREAVSWNARISCCMNFSDPCQPLREAVSWNASAMIMVCIASCQPLREAVSWNSSENMSVSDASRQPFREAVSWNINITCVSICNFESASSWGCELKYIKPVIQPKLIDVSLFVRLWVEMYILGTYPSPVKVSLFVRLWVEIWHATPYTLRQDRQSLREAVSWNTNNLTAINSE